LFGKPVFIKEQLFRKQLAVLKQAGMFAAKSLQLLFIQTNPKVCLLIRK
jgi:hypothetical protein